MEAKLVGTPVKRYEDIKLVQGAGRYVADIEFPGMVHACFVRSDYAHGHLHAVSKQAALNLPGVLAVISAEDIVSDVEPLDSFARLGDSTVKPIPHPILSSGKVRYVGEPVAVVLAESPSVAEDAADKVELSVEPLPAIIDSLTALEPEVALVHETLGTNVVLEFQLEGGEISKAFEQADLIISQDFRVPRLAASPIETRGCVAQYDKESNTLTLWSSSQVPHRLRTELSHCLRLPNDCLHVIAPVVGGAFGSKSAAYPEEIIVALLSKRFGKPVKWIEERRENLVAAAQGRGQFASVEVAVRKDAIVLGLRAKIVADLGAYFLFTTCVAPVLTALMASGPYRIPHISVRVQGVATNKVPLGTYRGAGRPEAVFYLERMMDIIALEMGLDPAEVRKRNLVPHDAFPYKATTGVIYDSGNYMTALDRGLNLLDYPAMRQRQLELRRRGEARLIGIGLGLYVELSGGVPLHEGAKAKLDSDGRVTIGVGVAPQGQGLETAFKQIVADDLGVQPESIMVLYGDSDIIPEGVGTFASRSLALGGSAIYLAVQGLKEKTRLAAAKGLGVPPESLHFGRAAWLHAETGRELSLVELARDSNTVFEVENTFQPAGFTTSFGAHLAMVEVEPDTREVKVLKYIAVDDCGRVINPLIVEGQIHGGIAQGISEGLWEQVVYDDSGKPLTASFLDYVMPVAENLPDFVVQRTETATPLNPLGAKGVGEAGATGAFAAVVNAVMDALKPLGIRHLDPPLTAEKIWRSVSKKS
jgi:carbon-monoxide dehydrogenase large subunit